MYDIGLVGADGFLGRAIARRSAASGLSVVPFTRSRPIVQDGTLSPAAAGLPVIVWAAGGVSPLVAAEQPEVAVAELREFTAALRAVASGGRPVRVLLLSSGGTVYGPPSAPPYREAEGVHPHSAYGRYMVAKERILHEEVGGTALRVANAYGPGQRGVRGQGVLAFWMRAAHEGRPIQLMGSPAVARDYVYVDDVAAAVVAAVEAAAVPAALNVGSGSPTSLEMLLHTLSEVVATRTLDVERLPSRGVDADSTWLDVSLARDTLGWEAVVSLPDGMERMWRWVTA